MNSWKEIWNKRRPAGVYDLADLIKFNGFDSEGTRSTLSLGKDMLILFSQLYPLALLTVFLNLDVDAELF